MSPRSSPQSATGVFQNLMLGEVVLVIGVEVVQWFLSCVEARTPPGYRRLAEVLGRLRVRLGADDVVHPLVHAVRVLRPWTRSSTCPTTRSCPPRERPVDRGGRLRAVQLVHLVLPGRARRSRALVNVSISSPRPTSTCRRSRLLLLEQVDGRVELLLVELVRIGDLQLGLRRLQVQRRVRDVDRPVVDRDLPLAGELVEDDRPSCRRLAVERLRVLHQEVGAPAVRARRSDLPSTVLCGWSLRPGEEFL